MSEFLTNEFFFRQALLLRGTFYSLLGEYTKAVDDYTQLVDDATVDAKVRVNALVKRATLRMQLGAAEASLHDLAMAAELGPDNADVFHHRGQVVADVIVFCSLSVIVLRTRFISSASSLSAFFSSYSRS